MKKIKITNESRTLFKEMVKKYRIVKEDFMYQLLSKVLGNQIKKAIDNDKDLQQAVKDTDADLARARDLIDGMIKQGLTPPQYMQKYATPALRAMIGKWGDYEKNPAKYNYILDK